MVILRKVSCNVPFDYTITPPKSKETAIIFADQTTPNVVGATSGRPWAFAERPWETLDKKYHCASMYIITPIFSAVLLDKLELAY